MKMGYVGIGRGITMPFVRLYDYDVNGATWLHSALLSLAVRAIDTFVLHEQPWIASIDGCQLTLRFALRDRGVIKVKEPLVFDCVYSEEGWAELADKAKGVMNPRPNVFNWLSEEGEAGLLLSPDGTW